MTYSIGRVGANSMTLPDELPLPTCPECDAEIADYRIAYLGDVLICNMVWYWDCPNCEELCASLW